MREKLVNEMLDSERAHVQALDVVVREYLSPLREANILPLNILQDIFSNLELIRNWNTTFLKSLQAHLDCGDTFGDVFLEMIPVMRQLYTQYSENYQHAMETYELAKKNKAFSTMIERRHKEINDTKDILTYLYLPVQRMIAYDSLLKDILSLTPRDHPDFLHLADALHSLRDVQYNADQRAKQRKNIDKVLEISGKLLFEDKDTILAAPHRRYVFEGEVSRLFNGKYVKDRYCYLFNDLFLCCKPKKKGKLEIDFKEPIETLKLEDMPNEEDFRYLFKIISAANEYVLSTADKDHWIALIQQCIKDKAEREEATIPHNAVEESSRESLINRIISWSKLDDAERVLSEVKTLALVLEKYKIVNVLQPTYYHGVL